MCDEITEAENVEYLQTRIKRRELSVGTGAALASLWTGCASPSPLPREPARTTPASDSSNPELPPASEPESTAPPPLVSRSVTIDTPDGSAEGHFVAPKDGKHPGVLLWPDVAGLRDAFVTMAARLAAEGYAVLAVNPYYRSAQLPILTTFSEWRTEEGKAKIAPMRAALTPEAIASDGAAFVAWLAGQPEVDPTRKLASAGYCMTGSFTFRTAAAAPDRVGAIASFHGGGLATNEPSSPHLLLSESEAALLACIAQNDHEREPETKATLEQAARAAGVPAEIEVYPAQHGFAVLDSPVYDETSAERAWARMLATFEQHL